MGLAARLACRLDTLGFFGQFRRMDVDWAIRNRSDMRLVETPHGNVRLRHCVGRPGNRPPLVLLIDPPNHPEHYDALMRMLLSDGWPSVTVIETLGFGFSRPSHRFDFAMNAYVESLLCVLNALNLHRIVLYGPCIEGYTALRFAQKHADKIAALGIGQVPSWEEATQNWLPTVSVLKDDKPFLGQLAFAMGKNRYVERSHKAVIYDRSLYSSFRSITAEAESHGQCYCNASGMQGYFAGPTPDFGTINAPTLVLWGDADPTHRNTNRASKPAKFAKEIEVRWPDAGHYPELEKAQPFVTVLRDLADVLE